MNFTERRNLEQFLDELKVPGNLPLDVWSDLVEDAIRAACPADSIIHEHVRKLRTQEKGESQADDPRLVGYPRYLTGARRMLALRSLDKPDETLEREVLAILDKKLMDTTAARLIKYAGPLIVTLIFGGTLWAGFEWRGAYDRMTKYLETLTADVKSKQEEATQKIKDALGDEQQKTGALGAVRERKEQAIRDIADALGSNDRKGTALGEITSSKNTALESIHTAVGDEASNTGVIAAIKLKEKEIRTSLEARANEVLQLKKQVEEFSEEAHRKRTEATQKIEDALGANDRKGTVLGEITSRKDAALESIRSVVGDEASNTGVIAAIKLKEKDTMKSLDDMVKDAPRRMENLEQRAGLLDAQLKDFESTAAKVTEAHQILTAQVLGVPPDAIGVLLSSSLRTVGVVGFVAGVLGSFVAMLVTRLFGR